MIEKRWLSTYRWCYLLAFIYATAFPISILSQALLSPTKIMTLHYPLGWIISRIICLTHPCECHKGRVYCLLGTCCLPNTLVPLATSSHLNFETTLTKFCYYLIPYIQHLSDKKIMAEKDKLTTGSKSHVFGIVEYRGLCYFYYSVIPKM